MQCVQIVAAARARGLSFAPRDLFAHRTVARLALAARRAPAPATPAAPVAATASAQELAELVGEHGD